MKNQQDQSKIPYTGLGIVFGTAIGAGITIATQLPILWAGVGTGVGLILGAIVDSTKKKS